MRQALDENNFAAAKEFSEKLKRYEHIKSERECEESLSSSIHQLETDLEDAKSNLDLDAAEEIHSKLMEEKYAMNVRFGCMSKIDSN
jgi:hypothetical protein